MHVMIKEAHLLAVQRSNYIMIGVGVGLGLGLDCSPVNQLDLRSLTQGALIDGIIRNAPHLQRVCTVNMSTN